MVQLPPTCPKCRKLLRDRPGRDVEWCPCGRWQYVEQLNWALFAGAVYRHLACVECGDGALCRDMVKPADGRVCAYRAHRHPLEGPCPGDVPRANSMTVR